MSAIYIVEPGGQQTSYVEEQARTLWQQGGISPQALYWREGMAEWRPATEFFAPGGLPVGTPNRTSSTRHATTGFAKDPTTLTKFLKVMLWISFGTAIVGVLVSSLSLATGNATRSSEEAFSVVDIMQALLGLGQLVVYVTTAIPFLMWIHRANRNARALGAEGLNFSPGWCVGWYFIPVMNLWKPFQAMKEIWQASRNPASWEAQEVPSLIGNWWALWLITGFLGQMSLRLSLQATSPGALMTSEIVSLISDVVDIALCLVAIKLVAAIYQMQSEWAGQNR